MEKLFANLTQNHRDDVRIYPSPAQLAAKERQYAAEQRNQADEIAAYDPEAAALLYLDADMCELWADEVQAGTEMGWSEYVRDLETPINRQFEL